jgi:hypothetical protein
MSGRVARPVERGNEGLVVNLGDVMELACALICRNSLHQSKA